MKLDWCSLKMKCEQQLPSGFSHGCHCLAPCSHCRWQISEGEKAAGLPLWARHVLGCLRTQLCDAPLRHHSWNSDKDNSPAVLRFMYNKTHGAVMGVGVKGNAGLLMKMKYSACINVTFLRNIGLVNLYRERCRINWLMWKEWNVFSANAANY